MDKKVNQKKVSSKEVVLEAKEPTFDPPIAKPNSNSPISSGSKSLLSGKELILGGGIVVLVLIIFFLFNFFTNSYRFSFKINELNYYSNDYTPSEFFVMAKDSDNFLVSVELIDGNSNPWVVNSMNLWLIAFNADKKKTTSLIKTIDSQGNIKSCLTNDGNIMSSRELSREECVAVLDSNNLIKINLFKSYENKVILFKDGANVYAEGGQAFAIVSYSFIKKIYPDFDKTLAIINEKIKSVN